MQIVVSPYPLTPREAPAMAALLLARRVVTLLPAPLDGNGDARSAIAAAGRVPTYREFMKSWAWAERLWVSGLIAGHVDGSTPAEDMFDVARRIGDDAALAPLREFSHERLYEDERQYLGAVAADLLKGGPDPGICVPLAAGLDRFASRHGMSVARAHPASVAQKVEAHLARDSETVVAPILLQASAERLLHAREVLHESLRRVWSRGDAWKGGGWKSAWAEYASAFDQRRAEVFEDSNEDEVRAVEGAAAITMMTLPGDAVLRSSLSALATLGSGRRAEVSNPEDLPARYDPLDAAPVRAVVVKVLGR